MRTTMGVAVGAVALAAVSVFGIAGLAGADTGEAGEAAMGGHRPQLTDEQRQCLADQGIAKPERPADGSRPQLTDEQKAERRAAMEAAAEACGLPERPERPRRPRLDLTDEQRTCLEQQGITKPERPADGTRPTEEQRAEHHAAMQAAAEACGIELPERPAGDAQVTGLRLVA